MLLLESSCNGFLLLPKCTDISSPAEVIHVPSGKFLEWMIVMHAAEDGGTVQGDWSHYWPG